MGNLGTTLIIGTALIAGLGIVTFFAVRRNATEGDRFVFSSIRLLLATWLLFVLVTNNFKLAAGSLAQLLGSERIEASRLLAPLFGGSEVRSNELFAAGLVGCALVAIGIALAQVGKVFAAVRARAGGSEIAIAVAKMSVWGGVAGALLWMDTSVLLFRAANHLWSAEMTEDLANLPSPDRIIAAHGGTMGAFMLLGLRIVYPLMLIVGEKHFASAWASFLHSTKLFWALRDPANRQAAPVQQPLPNVPPAPQGMAGPAGPMRPPIHLGGAQPNNGGGVAAGVAPGGSRVRIRRIPRAPEGGNGHVGG